MILFQNLPRVGCNLIIKGEAYRFDSWGFYKGIVKYNYLNIEKATVTSFITQGHLVEKAECDDYGDVLSKSTLKTIDLLNILKREQQREDCLAVLTRNLIFDGLVSKQYILVYRRR